MTATRAISQIRLQDLKRGDILLFRPSPAMFPCQPWIIRFQSLAWLPDGNDDTTHSAMCVDNDEKTGPVIAHTYQVDEKWGYFRHTLRVMQEEEAKFHPSNIDRPFLVFRPKNQKAAALAADIAGDEKANKDIQWTTGKLIKPFFRPSFWGLAKDRPFAKEPKTMPSEAICTEFVIKAVKIAEYKRHEAGEKIPDRMCIRSSSSPKALESYLYNDRENYELFVYPGKNPLQKLITNITAELKNIEARHFSCNAHSRVKRQVVALMCEQMAEKYKGADNNVSELDQCLELLSKVMPVLNQHSGFSWFGLRNTASYNVVRDQVRKMGIFERDIQKYTKDHPHKEEKQVRLAQQKNGR